MYLKRINSGTKDAPVFDKVKVLRETDRWRPSRRVLDKGLAEGWLSMGQGKVTLHTPDDDRVYRIERRPGRYCCFCGEPQETEADARGHVHKQHKGDIRGANAINSRIGERQDGR